MNSHPIEQVHSQISTQYEVQYLDDSPIIDCQTPRRTFTPIDERYELSDHNHMGVLTDTQLLEDMLIHIFNNNVSSQNVHVSLSIVFTCSSLGSSYSFIVPKILSYYLSLAQSDSTLERLEGITANVVHAIPQHKTIKNELSEDVLRSPIIFTRNSSDASHTANGYSHQNLTPSGSQSAYTYDSFNGNYNIHDSGCGHCVSPKSSVFSPDPMTSIWTKKPETLEGLCFTPLVRPKSDGSLPTGILPISMPRSPPAYPSTPVSSFFSLPGSRFPTDENSDYDLEDRIYNTFAFMPRQKNALIVPPNSCHFNFALYPLPYHLLPPFKDVIKARFAETMPLGSMVLCYPTSLALYSKYILPCLDLALHQLLALNLISTQACEAITLPPQSHIYSYETQRAILEQLPNSEIVYSHKIDNYSPSQWGYRWISEDMLWIRQTLTSLDVSSQDIIKLINALTRNPLWSASASCGISLFIVRKQGYT